MSFFGVKYPYTSQQQLNLDWIMDHVANLIPLVRLPALAGDQYSDVLTMIDLKAQEIPKGVTILQMGAPDDPLARQCMVILNKSDDDNMIGFVVAYPGDISINGLCKIGGVWD